MSGELRAVLTEAIKAHKPTTKRINHPRRQEFLLNLDACMGCEWTEQDGGDHDSHVADVIASLPGVAVIQLPEPTEAVTMQDCAGSGKPFKPATLSRDGEVAKCSACGTNRYVRDDGSIEPHQVPVAAVLAEGEDNHA
ncbi:hypothetical protein SEA_ERICMILLARD_72 [Mycobacterium phage EricMillard]|nr:hypothetical protein SEA_ERICMILLARD_72 [Mycobacterium phage EricMillard]